MFPSAIVPALDIRKSGQPGYAPRRKISMVHQFAFECLEKTLRHGIVPAVTFSAQALHDWQSLQMLPKFSASLLHATIRMKEKFTIYPSVLEGHTPGGYARINRF